MMIHKMTTDQARKVKLIEAIKREYDLDRCVDTADQVECNEHFSYWGQYLADIALILRRIRDV